MATSGAKKPTRKTSKFKASREKSSSGEFQDFEELAQTACVDALRKEKQELEQVVNDLTQKVSKLKRRVDEAQRPYESVISSSPMDIGGDSTPGLWRSHEEQKLSSLEEPGQQVEEEDESPENLEEHVLAMPEEDIKEMVGSQDKYCSLREHLEVSPFDRDSAPILPLDGLAMRTESTQSSSSSPRSEFEPTLALSRRPSTAHSEVGARCGDVDGSEVTNMANISDEESFMEMEERVRAARPTVSPSRRLQSPSLAGAHTSELDMPPSTWRLQQGATQLDGVLEHRPAVASAVRLAADREPVRQQEQRQHQRGQQQGLRAHDLHWGQGEEQEPFGGQNLRASGEKQAHDGSSSSRSGNSHSSLWKASLAPVGAVFGPSLGRDAFAPQAIAGVGPDDGAAPQPADAFFGGGFAALASMWPFGEAPVSPSDAVGDPESGLVNGFNGKVDVPCILPETSLGPLGQGLSYR